MKKGYYIAIAFILITAFCALSCKDHSAEEQGAVTAAKSWLQVIDDGKYGESWDQSCEFFKKAVSKEEWIQKLEAFRKVLGKPSERAVVSKKYATSLPGAPDGEYVMIQFSTSFENKKEAVETVTPMKGKDGVWRVSGYYIK